VEAIQGYLALHQEFVVYCGAAFILLLHYFGHSKQIILMTVLIVGLAALMFIVLARTREPFGFPELASVLLLYGVGLFVILGDLMLNGAKYFTRKRGAKWTKELDYFYLAIGSVGILIALNRVGSLTGRFEGIDIHVIAPLFLTTAVVIRFIKTRAEIEEWNKLTD
jgi:hypothetical protein